MNAIYSTVLAISNSNNAIAFRYLLLYSKPTQFYGCKGKLNVDIKIKIKMSRHNKWVNTKQILVSLEQKLNCFVCKKLPEDPHILWCCHSFCKACLAALQTCPICNFAFTPRSAVPHLMLSKLIQILQVASDVSKCAQEEKEKESSENSKSGQLETCVDETITGIENNKSKELYLSPKRLTKSRSGRARSCQKKMLGMLEKNITETIHSTNKVLKPKPKKLKNNIHNKYTNLNSCVSDQTLKSPRLLSPQTNILFSVKKAKVNNRNIKGETPLQIACRQGKIEKVVQLLEDGAQSNVKDYANWTPLCDAVSVGNIHVVRALLKAGAAVNTPAHLNTTAIIEAVLKKDKAMVELLMSFGADINQRTALNNTAWSLADEETRALMKISSICVQPHPKVRIIPKAILVHKLPQNQVDLVMSLCQQFSLTLTTSFTEETTHVIVDKSAKNTCHGSMEVMEAILRGCCVIGLDWVTASLEDSDLLPVDEFEPSGTNDIPDSLVFQKARLNKEQLLPRLFDGCHISLQHDQTWNTRLKKDVMTLVGAAGAQFQSRACDAERIPDDEQTIMFHASPSSPFARVSHIVLYQTSPSEPLLKYNMAHVKSKSIQWFLKCIKTFNIS